MDRARHLATVRPWEDEFAPGLSLDGADADNRDARPAEAHHAGRALLFSGIGVTIL